MPETVSALTTAAKNSLHQTNAWVWLIEADVDGTNCIRVCDSAASITYGGKVYVPFPLSIEGLASDTAGTLPQVTISVSNLSREVSDQLDAGNLIDRRVQIYMMNRADTAFAFDRGLWRILDATLDERLATFRVGPYGLFDAPFPARRQARTRCDYIYGGSECQYKIALPNLVSGTYPNFAGSTCDLSLDGGNGCRAHGANATANGLPAFWPSRFGGHIGIPKRKGSL